MFEQLERINARPRPFEFYTAEELWTDGHVSKQMLAYHLDEKSDFASRNSGFVDQSVAWMADRFSIEKGSKVIDFGCGPGLYTTRFAALGAEVVGLDFSARSIDHAKRTAGEKNLAIEYVLGNYLDYAPKKKFDLVTFIYWDIAPLSPDQRGRLYRIFRDCLADSGALVLDVPSLSFFGQAEEKRTFEKADGGTFWSAEPHYIFKNTFLYPKEKLYLDKYVILERSRTREIYNWLQCFSPETLAAEFKANGLQLTETYGDVAGAPYDAEAIQFAAVGRKTL